MSGPYLDSDRFSLTSDERLYLCRTCTGELLRGVDKVARSELLDVMKERDARAKYAKSLEAEYRGFTETIAKLEKQVEAAQIAQANAEAVLKATQDRMKEISREPAELRRQLLQAELDAQPAPVTPKPTNTKRKAA